MIIFTFCFMLFLFYTYLILLIMFYFVLLLCSYSILPCLYYKVDFVYIYIINHLNITKSVIMLTAALSGSCYLKELTITLERELTLFTFVLAPYSLCHTYCILYMAFGSQHLKVSYSYSTFSYYFNIMDTLLP